MQRAGPGAGWGTTRGFLWGQGAGRALWGRGWLGQIVAMVWGCWAGPQMGSGTVLWDPVECFDSVTPQARCPLFGHHQATGAPGVTPKRGWGRWGRGEQQGSGVMEPWGTGARFRPPPAPLFPCQEPLSAATTRSGPMGHLQPFPSTYPISLPLRPTSMRPRRCRNNRLTKGYF